MDFCRSPRADQCGTPKTKLSTAPAPAARQHGRRLTHIDPLVLVVAPPPRVALYTPSTKVPAHTKSPVCRYWDCTANREGAGFSSNRQFCDEHHSGRSHRKTRITR